MIYECLQCHTPQRPGAAVCPRCAAHFDGPVPADAVVPEPPPAPVPPPMPVPDLAQGHAPPPPQWVMPTTPGMPDAAPVQAARPLSRPLLIAGAAILLAALALGGYTLFSSTQSSSTSVPAAVAVTPLVTPAAPFSSATPPPVLLPTVSQSGTPNTTTQAAPIGRWMSKTFDFYEFDQSGSGTRGNVGSAKPAQTFEWTVEKNDLILSLTRSGGGTETVPFSYGPGGSTLYLRQPSGHYLALTRQS